MNTRKALLFVAQVSTHYVRLTANGERQVATHYVRLTANGE
jgi:hypothetical protein